jgi:hypothetical protein
MLMSPRGTSISIENLHDARQPQVYCGKKTARNRFDGKYEAIFCLNRHGKTGIFFFPVPGTATDRR